MEPASFPSLERETKIIYETRDASKISSTRRFRSDSLVQQISLLIFLFFFFKFPHRYSYFFRFHIHIYTDIPSSSTEKIKRIHFETRIQIYIYKNSFSSQFHRTGSIHSFFQRIETNHRYLVRMHATTTGLYWPRTKKKKNNFRKRESVDSGLIGRPAPRKKTHVVDASLRNGECQRRHCQPWCSKLD